MPSGWSKGVEAPANAEGGGLEGGDRRAFEGTTNATNPWIARRLHMGDPDAPSRYCSECRSGRCPVAQELLNQLSDSRV